MLKLIAGKSFKLTLSCALFSPLNEWIEDFLEP